jgi:hypothetical protein
MRPRRVYPLVVEVPRGQGAVPLEAPTGVFATLRAVVPGAVVAPAEQSLEVSRPGARATFYVTPVARGRLPEARVEIRQEGRPVQEIRTPMAARTQRLAWALLLLALVLPALLVHWTYSEPLRGQVADKRKKIDAGPGPAEQAQGGPAPGMPGGPPGRPQAAPANAETPLPDDTYEAYMRTGTPGEVLDYRLRNGLQDNLPEFPGSPKAIAAVTGGAGAAYDWLCGTARDVRPAFWLGVILLLLALAAWVVRRPARARQRGTVALAVSPPGATLHGDQTAETLPLTTD